MSEKEKKRQSQFNKQRTQPEEISFFSLKGYIIAVVVTLVLTLIPPLIYDFNFSILLQSMVCGILPITLQCRLWFTGLYFILLR